MSSALTRRILRAMRSASGPNVRGVTLSRRYGKRRYFLEVGDGRTYVGHVASFDATSGELWVRPDEPHRDAAMLDAVRPTLEALRAIQREHGTPRTYVVATAPNRLPYLIGA